MADWLEELERKLNAAKQEKYGYVWLVGGVRRFKIVAVFSDQETARTSIIKSNEPNAVVEFTETSPTVVHVSVNGEPAYVLTRFPLLRHLEFV